MKNAAISELLKLSLPERVLLAETLWDSIANEVANEKLSDSEVHLLEERVEEYRRKPAEKISWEELKASILKRI